MPSEKEINKIIQDSPVEPQDYDEVVPDYLLNPLRGSQALAEFLKERKG